MEKIKNMLNPGHGKDDEVMYGDGSNTSQTGTQSTGEHLTEDPLYTKKDAPKEHGILRQILNPGGEKYDQAAYGQNATADPTAVEGNNTNTGYSQHASSDPTSIEGNNTTTQGTSGLTGSQGQTSGHHYGRDAAAAGGVGAAGYEAEKHLHNRNDPANSSSTTGNTGSYGTQQNTGAYGSQQQGYGNTSSTTGTGSGYQSGPTGSSIGQQSQTGYQNQPTSGHHYGRDAAEVGGAGALGTGAYEAEKHHHNNQNQSNTASGGLLSGNNRYDSAPGSSTNSSIPGQTSQSGDHHYGRDAAGAGALGAGAYEAEKHHHNKQNQSNTSGSGGLLSGNNNNNQSNTTGSSSTGSNIPGQSSQSGDHHYGRDAAGAGALGAAGYEAEKHHHNKDQSNTSGNTNFSHPSGSSTGPSQGSSGGNLNPDTVVGGAAIGKAGIDSDRHHRADGSEMEPDELPGDLGPNDPRRSNAPRGGQSSGSDPYDKMKTSGGNTTSSNTDSNTGNTGNNSGNDSHLGRDAAGAGAAGLAGREALKHEHNRNDPSATSGSNTRGIGSNDNQYGSGSQQGQSSHLGRDAAGAGALGAGAYEAEKHHHNKQEQRQGQTAGGIGSNDPYSSSGNQYGSGSQQGQSSHLGRDAAGAGALGAGAYEAEKHHHNHNNQNQGVPSGTTSRADAFNLQGHEHGGHGHVYEGDPCPPGSEPSRHGMVAGPHTTDTANRLDPHVPGGFPSEGGIGHSQHNTGRDAALAGGAGAAALEGEHHHRHHGHHHNQQGTTGQTGGLTGGLTGQQPTGSSYTDQRAEAPGQSGHHYGRDAAAVGGAGALGTGAYEAEKHHHQNQSGSGLTGSSGTTSGSYPDRTAQYGQQGNQSHLGRDAAAVGGGAGAAGLAGHEMSKRDEKKELKHEEREAKHAHDSHSSSSRHHDESEKKPGLLDRLLHRNKNDDDVTDSSSSKHKHEAEAAAAGTGVAGVGAYEHERNKNAGTSGSNYGSTQGSNTLGRDSATTGGLSGSGGPDRLRQDYNEEGATQPDYIATNPERLQQGSGYGSNTTGGSGLSSVGGAAENYENTGSHHNKLHKDPPESVRRELEQKARTQGQDGLVTESRTGLPMNVGKYGSGTGGTDGNTNIHGYQS